MDRDKDFLVWYGLEFLKMESFELISEWSFGIDIIYMEYRNVNTNVQQDVEYKI